MKYIIDTDAGTCAIYKEATAASATSKAEKMVTELASHRGDTEYTGFCATVQKWYYGSVVKAAWCATTISYLLSNIAGINIKAENVNKLREKLAADHEHGTYYSKQNLPATIKRGDILFWLWSGDTMTDSSSKHVGIADKDASATATAIYCLGGNQKDKVCTLNYARENLYALYRLEG